MRIISSLPLILALALLPPLSARADDGAAVRAATRTVAAQSYRPGASIVVMHVAILRGYALSVFAQGGSAGEVLLKKYAGTWTVLGKGGGRMDADIVRAFGVPADIAEQLVALLARS